MTVRLPSLVTELAAEAERANERRLLVLAGDRDAGFDAAYDVIDAYGRVGRGTDTDGDSDPDGDGDGDSDTDDDSAPTADPGDPAVTLVTTREGFRYPRVEPTQADRLLGTTRDVVVLDCHEAFSANALGQVTGSVDGGGLLVLLTPPMAALPTGLSALVDRVLVPPFSREDVGNRFRRRLRDTLETHPGVAIVDLSTSPPTVRRDGRTHPDSAAASSPTPRVHADTPIPAAAYEACRTADQARALARLSALTEPGNAVVLEADRGRGKSSAAGLAAGALAAAGDDVLVTAPAVENAAEIFARAAELLADLACLAGDTASDAAADGRVDADGEAAADAATDGDPDGHTGGDTAGRVLTTTTGGRVRFRPPPAALDAAGAADCLFVDEAATLPVGVLEGLLAAPSVAFCTTVHGYEGTGRGFAIRFRDRLAVSPFSVHECTLEEPIRYARGDPLESWLFRTLLLDAAPPAAQLVAEATSESVTYQRLDREALAADEPLLRSVVGLLVAAHYKTEPTDLLRLLDAPNVAVRTLTHEGHVVSVALLAREGGLDAETRRGMYRGARVRGNMLPDVLTSQLRDPDAAGPVGYRVMRIATHHAARSRGLGSQLLSRCHREFGDDVDWFGVGYGATPDLLAFWRANGYRTVHLSTTANAASGEHSALMLRGCSPAGRALTERHVGWFRDRVGDVLADALATLDADVVRGALRAAGPTAAGRGASEWVAAALDGLTERDWRVLAGVADGPGTYEAAPGVFRTLTLAHLLEPRADLRPRQERLLVRKVLQGEPWESVAADLAYVSTSQCMREMSTIAQRFCAVVDRDIIADERARYED